MFVPCSCAVVRDVFFRLPSMIVSVPRTPTTRIVIATMISMSVMPASPSLSCVVIVRMSVHARVGRKRRVAGSQGEQLAEQAGAVHRGGAYRGAGARVGVRRDAH